MELNFQPFIWYSRGKILTRIHLSSWKQGKVTYVLKLYFNWFLFCFEILLLLLHIMFLLCFAVKVYRDVVTICLFPAITNLFLVISFKLPGQTVKNLEIGQKTSQRLLGAPWEEWDTAASGPSMNYLVSQRCLCLWLGYLTTM